MRNRMPPLSLRMAGFSLVELMIAITLGLIVLLAIGSIFIGSRQTYRVQEDNARIQEAGRYALEVIGRSLRQAGSEGEFDLLLATVFPLQCATPGVCAALDGTDGVAPAPDTMVVQFYAQSEEPSGATWVARDCTGGLVALNAVVTNTFNVAGTSLQCTGNVGGTEALVEDVEDLQIIYGIDTSAPVPDQSADLYVAAPTAAQWDRVVTARVCVGIRSANNGLVATAQQYLNCAGAMGTATGATAFTGATDLRLHRSFVATYNLRNRINRAP